MIDNVSEAYIKRGIALLRAAEGDAIAVAKILDEIHLKIIAKINKQFLKVHTMGELLSLESEIKKEIDRFYLDDYTKELSEISMTVIAKEIDWNTKEISFLIGEDADKILSPKYKEVVDSSSSKKFQGKTFSRWIDESNLSNKAKIEKVLRTGFVEGKSISNVVSEISDFQRGEKNSIKTLTRSYFMHNAVEAKQSVFDLNPNIVEGIIWNSTLDSRTTPLICGIRDQKEYDKNHNPIGHSLPWIYGPGRAHFGCRSIGIPKLIGVENFTNRSAIIAGDDYQRGDNLTKTGKVRKANKASFEAGIFDVKRVTTATQYEGFLKAQAKKNIDYVADILKSKEDAILFRDGKVSLLELAKENPVFNPTNRNFL